ncbi:MAG: PHP domain-containing protein [Actinomycetota bacterium]|nr:PHP domain-containing protein [Actinomycetota bacterium]
MDFHVHSLYSPDSVVDFDSLVRTCKERGIDAVAIMDHDVVEGAFAFAEKAQEMRLEGKWAPRILIGEEVRTKGGEICGLFLKEKVPRHLSPRETMELIRLQGGLVYVPHPFDLLKLKRLKSRELAELSDLIDIIEVFNGKPRFPLANLLARRFVRHHHFLCAAGSDSHEPTKIGTSFVEVEDFNSPQELLSNLEGGRISGKLYCPLDSAFRRLWKVALAEKKKTP